MRRNILIAIAALVALGGAFPGVARAASGWVEVDSPHFVVVSNVGEREARSTAAQFEQIRALFRQVLPVTAEHSGPLITIVAVKDEKSLSELLPEFWTKGHTHPAGLFENAMDQYYIALELDAQGPNPYETIYHEYYHSLTMPYLPGMPTWLSEGLADFFGNSEVQGKTAIVGEAAAGLLYQLVNGGSLIPLQTLFRVDRSSPYYNEENKANIFYAESWALTHYLMIGDNQAHKPELTAYLAALGAGASEDDAAVKAFGDLNKLQRNLEQYVRQNSFYQIRYPAPEKTPDSALKARALSDADVAAYEGGLFATRGRDDEAIASLNHAIALDPKNALAYQNLAVAQFMSGEHSEAEASASQAIALDRGSALVFYLRAYLTFKEAPGATDPQIEDDLRKSIANDAEFAPPYGLLAVYLASQGQNLPEALALARDAISLEPGNSEYRISEAQVLLRMKNYDGARASLTLARASAASSQQLLQTDMLLSNVSEMEKYASGAGSASGPVILSRDGSDPAVLRRRNGIAVDDPKAVDATGTVADVSCAGGLKLQLKIEDGTVLVLHTAAGGGVKIVATSEIPADFTPCGLKGRRIAATYTPDPDGGHAGTIEVLRLLESQP